MKRGKMADNHSDARLSAMNRRRPGTGVGLMNLSRRELLSTCPIALACASAAAQTKDEPRYVEAKTVYGRVRGAQSDGLTTFKGIPYAGPVSGANRFKAAPPLKPWTGLRDALA